MFPESFKKFYVTLGLCIMFGLGAMTMLTPGDFTGAVVNEVASTGTFDWLIFLFGLGIGAILTVGVGGLVWYEYKRL